MGNANIPICPFCWGSLSYPEEIRLSETDLILGGHCLLCGAHFIVDPTGKNVGEAMVQGLGIVADELGKNLCELEPDEDYEDCVLCYDVQNHKTLGQAKGIDEYGRMYVIRVKKKSND